MPLLLTFATRVIQNDYISWEITIPDTSMVSGEYEHPNPIVIKTDVPIFAYPIVILDSAVMLRHWTYIDTWFMMSLQVLQ